MKKMNLLSIIKMRLSLMVTCFLLSSSILFAQNVEISWSTKQEPFKSGLITKVKSIKSDSIANYYVYDYTTVYTNQEKCLVKIDKVTNKSTVLKFNFEDKKSKRELLNTALIDSVLHVFTYFNNKKQKKIFVFDETVDINNMKLNQDPNKISELAYDSISGINSDKVELNISFRNNRILMLYNYKTSKGETYGFEVYNKQFQLEWKKFNGFLSSRSGYNYITHILDNDGNVYGLERNFLNKSDANHNFSKSEVSLVYYPKNENGSRIKELKLPKNAFVTGAEIAINEKNELVCTGIYANSGTTSAIGTFSFRMSPQLLLLVDSTSTAFEKEMLLKGLTGKGLKYVTEKIEKGEDFEEDFYYQLSDVYFHKDGSYDVIVEKNREYQRYYTQAGYSYSTTTTINYHVYDDILLFRCNANGSLRWAHKIPKTQYLADGYRYLGTYCTYREDSGKINLIYNLPNTDESVFKLKPDNKTVTMMRSYDNDGNETISKIFDNPKISNTFCPVFSEQDKNGNLRLVRYNYTDANIFSGYNALTMVFGNLKIRP